MTSNEKCSLKLAKDGGPEIYLVSASFISWHQRSSSLVSARFHIDHEVLRSIDLVVREVSNISEHVLDLKAMLPSRTSKMKFVDFSDWDIAIKNFNTRTRKTGYIVFPNRGDAAAMIEYARHHNGIVH